MLTFRKNPVFYILLLTLVVRLIIFFIALNAGENSFYLFDSYRYLNLGENLFSEGLYTENLGEPVFESVFVPPGAPVLFYALNSLGGIPAIILFHILCQVITCYLLVRIIPLVFHDKTGRMTILTGFLFALDIPTVVLGNVIMTETVFTTLLFAFVYFFALALKEHKIQMLLYASLFLGVSALFRPIIFYFPLFLLVVSWIILRPINLLFVKKIMALFIPFYLITGSWMLVNHHKHGHFFFSYIGEFNLGYFQASDIYAQKYGISLNEAREKFYYEVQHSFDESEVENVDQVVFYSAFGKRARKIIMENPIHFLKNMAKANAYLFFRPVRDYLKITLGSNELFHTRSKNHSWVIQILTYWQVIVNVSVFLLIPFGFIQLYKNHNELFCFFLFFIAYFMLVCSGPEIDARFRVPMVPVLLILSTSGIFFLLKKFRVKDVKDAQDNSTFAS